MNSGAPDGDPGEGSVRPCTSKDGRERECTGDLRIIRRRGEYLVVLDSVSGIKIGHEVLVGSRVLRVKKLEGLRLITDHGEHPLHEIEGRVLGRIGPRHQLYRELMNWRNRNGS
ncbi:unknown [Methanothermobacter thermautotrophicus str. Delta H]|uniref:Uncharacterized protein n=2 Tax=Methanothermobacter thermautotrophicus TaxID=145262 RepID=O27395_METTH|nr:unknown [Methanothermobacter thermautotrophicus str. Delta H]